VDRVDPRRFGFGLDCRADQPRASISALPLRWPRPGFRRFRFDGRVPGSLPLGWPSPGFRRYERPVSRVDLLLYCPLSMSFFRFCSDS